MDDDQREARAADSSTRPTSGEERETTSPAAAVARMLANPRRVRRS
ncbi:hypothetical protein [Blastococcus sp. SYSU DS0617]